MTRPDTTETPTGQTPGPATPAERREKSRFGKVFFVIFSAFAAIMFLIYIAIVTYGVTTSATN